MSEHIVWLSEDRREVIHMVIEDKIQALLRLASPALALSGC